MFVAFWVLTEAFLVLVEDLEVVFAERRGGDIGVGCNEWQDVHDRW